MTYTKKMIEKIEFSDWLEDIRGMSESEIWKLYEELDSGNTKHFYQLSLEFDQWQKDKLDRIERLEP